MILTTLPARQCGKSYSHQQHVEIGLLNTLFDAGCAISVTDLEITMGRTRRDLWIAIREQARLGNIKKGQPIELTSSARIAIAAGRVAGAVAMAV